MGPWSSRRLDLQLKQTRVLSVGEVAVQRSHGPGNQELHIRLSLKRWISDVAVVAGNQQEIVLLNALARIRRILTQFLGQLGCDDREL